MSRDPRRGGLRRSRRWGAAVAGAVAAAGLAGCSSARADLGTSDSPCYVALPAAATAVHHEGRLLGVRLRTVGSLRGTSQLASVVPRHGDRQRVCVVAFAGNYDAAQVVSGRGRPSGHLAVVILGYPDDRVEATILLRHPPLEFGHSRLGPA